MENVSSARPTGKFPEKVENLKGRPVFPVGTFRTEFRVPCTHFNSAVLASRRVTGSAPYPELTIKCNNFSPIGKSGVRSIRKFGFRFQNLHPDFPIEREIRKRISPPRNSSAGWISFLPFNWEIRNYSILLSMRACARPLFLRTVFQILFRISQSNGKNENPKTDISALKSFFGFRVRLQIRNPDFKILIQISQSNAPHLCFPELYRFVI